MSDMGEVFKALKQHRQQHGFNRRLQATLDYEQASGAAAQFNMQLIRHTETHYSLRHNKGWIINLYPGNQRIFRDQNNKVHSPYLKLPNNWTLLDVVEACAVIEEKERIKVAEVVREELQGE